MPTTNSAKKRMRQDQKRRLRNRAKRTEIKTSTKKLTTALEGGKKDEAQALFRQLQVKMDKAAKGSAAIHKNKAARRKSRLQKKLNKMLAGAK